jgi:hypothetical protein
MWTNYGTNIAKHDILIPFWFPSCQHLQCSSKNWNNIIILYNPSPVCQKLIKRWNPAMCLLGNCNVNQLWFCPFNICIVALRIGIILSFHIISVILMPVRQQELTKCKNGKTWYFLWFSLCHRLCYAANETTRKLQCDNLYSLAYAIDTCVMQIMKQQEKCNVIPWHDEM